MSKVISKDPNQPKCQSSSRLIARPVAIKGRRSILGHRSYSIDSSASNASSHLQKVVFSEKGNKSGTDICRQKVRGNKSGISKKSDSSEEISGRRTTAAWWFNARGKISGERTSRSYACERDVPIEVQDRLVPVCDSLALWNLD